MRRISGIAALAAVLACAAAAQDIAAVPVQGPTAQEKAAMEKMLAGARVLSVEGGVMGPAVKGAPYAADEIRESTQTLADGTRIHNETRTEVYRDSEGRVRRETPNEISIWDPATGTTYILDPKTNTARKLTLKFTFTQRRVPNGGKEQQAQMGGIVTASSSAAPPPPPPRDLFFFATGDGAGPERSVAIARPDGPVTVVPDKTDAKTESLGSQTTDGVVTEGTRNTMTIESGAIGNDRPIQSVTERWYSPDLQVVTMLKHTDPRTGEDVVRLTNIRRGPQDPSLFQVPPGYLINEPK